MLPSPNNNDNNNDDNNKFAGLRGDISNLKSKEEP